MGKTLKVIRYLKTN